MELKGKVAVVTGAASGIGLALAQRFAGEEMSVVLADIEPEPLRAATESVGATGAEVLAVPTDVRDPQALDALAEATIERFGAAHVLCNNAGVAVGGSAWTVDPERWRWIIDVNLLGVVNGIRSFVPHMIEQGEGHVVNTSSAAGLITGPGMSPYFATKHAVVALSESLHYDLTLGGHPIGVSVLCPEWVRTRIGESDRNEPAGLPLATEDPSAAFMREVILGAIAEGLDPAEVADMVLHAVRSGQFYVLPHPTTLALAQRRWATIESGEAPTLRFGPDATQSDAGPVASVVQGGSRGSS